jgi:hypothetical protein
MYSHATCIEILQFWNSFVRCNARFCNFVFSSIFTHRHLFDALFSLSAWRKSRFSHRNRKTREICTQITLLLLTSIQRRKWKHLLLSSLSSRFHNIMKLPPTQLLWLLQEREVRYFGKIQRTDNKKQPQFCCVWYTNCTIVSETPHENNQC